MLLVLGAGGRQRPCRSSLDSLFYLGEYKQMGIRLVSDVKYINLGVHKTTGVRINSEARSPTIPRGHMPYGLSTEVREISKGG